MQSLYGMSDEYGSALIVLLVAIQSVHEQLSHDACTVELTAPY
jgi:hypothetical protein